MFFSRQPADFSSPVSAQNSDRFTGALALSPDDATFAFGLDDSVLIRGSADQTIAVDTCAVESLSWVGSSALLVSGTASKFSLAGSATVFSGANFSAKVTLSLSPSLIKAQSASAETFSFSQDPVVAALASASRVCVAHGDCAGLFDPATGERVCESRAPLRAARLTCGAFTSGESSLGVLACFAASDRLEPLVFDARTGGFPSAAALLAASRGKSPAAAAAVSTTPNFFDAAPRVGRGTQSGAFAIAAHPLRQHVVATAQRDGVIALFDLRFGATSRALEPLAIVHTHDAGAQVVSMCWNHSPADVLTVVTSSGVEAVSFSSSAPSPSFAVTDALAYPLLGAVSQSWCPAPRVTTIDSVGRLHTFSLADEQISSLAPTQIPRRPVFADISGAAGAEAASSSSVDVFAVPRGGGHHHQTRKQQQQGATAAKTETEAEKRNLARALQLSYRRRVNEAKALTLEMLSTILDSREKNQSGGGGARDADAAPDSATQRRVDDIILLSIGPTQQDGQTQQLQSRQQLSTSIVSLLGPDSTVPADLRRALRLQHVTASLAECALVAPRELIALGLDKSKAATLPAAAARFLSSLLPSAAVDSRLVAVSVHLTVAKAVAEQDAKKIASHRQLLARVIADGAVSPHLTQRVLRLLLWNADTVADASWIVENSLLSRDTSSSSSASAAKKSSGKILKDDVDGASPTKKTKKEHGAFSESDTSTDEDEDEEDDEIRALGGSPGGDSDNVDDEADAAFRRAHPMLDEAQGPAPDKQRRVAFAILEALCHPLACDADNDDAAVADFFESGAASALFLQSSAASSSSSSAASRSFAFARKRDKRSSRDAKRLLKIFVRDCAHSATSDPLLFDRVVRVALRLREMEARWRSAVSNAAAGTVRGSSAPANTPAPELLKPAEQCARLFVNFERECRGAGLSVVPSRFLLSRYVAAMRSCRKDAAALWMAAQLADVLNAKSCSRPLAAWMLDFAESLVAELCDTADLVMDAADNLVDIAAMPPPAAGGGGGKNASSNNSISNNAAATEKEVVRIATEMHKRLARLIICMYECDAVYDKLPPEPETQQQKDNGGDEKNQQQSARAFMGENLDRIGDAMIDALGAWNRMLQESKAHDAAGRRSVAGNKSVAELVKEPVERFGRRLAELRALLGEQVADDTYETIMGAIDDHLAEGES